MKECGHHLVGNRDCPYPVLYVVTWTPHRPHRMPQHQRQVCALHLMAAIDDALEDSARFATVQVNVIP